ncbi:MAG: signal recognition particle protein [Mobiluncus porci]|uniref:Signal recognition particle protein n=1 Tax=Mobiluncus porci TaxID=2652278 RepID=A0A7K0K586_9ACTO|nr:MULTISPECIES: signal recognition particle protein [Mobiluncus]MCI6583659.1 signal recognition particle protein [Mobiluncus sp.]MDD7541150.1 signal recognition particle protein [Mobiluncus porci]MDY5748038.1 signal recognition particle protein [Mobiluncus porci]MST50240.1 signal recognition particle protein [Mobiluncus porci]
MFNKLQDRISESFKHLRKKGKLSEADVDETVGEIRRALIEADVALEVVKDFSARVKEKAYGAARSEALNPAQQIVKIVNDELIEILGGEDRELHFARPGKGPTVFMLAGLQGAGKTTLAGKLGRWLGKQDKKVLLVAADLQRPNAVTQLEIVGEQAGVTVFAPEPGNGVGDPVDVARRGLALASGSGYDVMIVDTAGRLGVDEELMAQARAIRDEVQPEEVLFVLDAMIGQDAVRTARAFQEGVDFTGVVLTKLDGDARGGAALSVRGVTGVPVLFASTGEGLDDFERFHADRMASRILDMGDMLSLIEKAQETFDMEQAEKLAGKIQQGQLTLEDFLNQLQQIKKLGSMKKLLGMMPGAGKIREQLDQFDEREVDRIEAIVRSMTPAERRDVKILNGSRRARIAAGSGTTVADVNGLVDRFEMAQKMMGGMAGMAGAGADGMGMMPGFGRMPGMGKHSKAKMAAKSGKKSKAQRKAKSGNPAKAARQAREALEGGSLAGAFGGGQATGLPAGAGGFGGLGSGGLGGLPGMGLGGGQVAGAGQGLGQGGAGQPALTTDDLPDDIKRMLGGL